MDLLGNRRQLYRRTRESPPPARRLLLILFSSLAIIGLCLAADAWLFEASKNHFRLPPGFEGKGGSGDAAAAYEGSIEEMQCYYPGHWLGGDAPWPVLLLMWMGASLIGGAIQFFLIVCLLYGMLWALGQRPGIWVFFRLAIVLMPWAAAAHAIVAAINAVTYLMVDDVSIINSFGMIHVISLVYMGLVAEALIAEHGQDRFRVLIAMVPYAVLMMFSLIGWLYLHLVFMDSLIDDTLRGLGVLP